MSLQSLEAALAGGDGLVALALLAAATLVSEDLACIAGGLLVAAGEAAFLPVTAACFIGIFLGDLGLVAVGRIAGRGALTRRPLKDWVSPAAVARAERWFATRGGRIILLSRFMPGTRLPAYLAAGLLHVPLRRFVGWFALACALWTPLLVGGAALAGEAASHWLRTWATAVPWLVVTGLMVWVVTRVAVRAATWSGRRRLLGSWRRLTRWEFWPRWAVYPPVVLYILLQAARARSLTWFTAVNPGIGAGGGLVGESKSAILTGLAGAGETIATWTTVPPGPQTAREQRIARFMAAHGLGFPLVLKPDVGERGSGVVIARDAAALAAALAAEPGTLIAQAYVPGVEFGVFYWRIPSAGRGEILAITDKRRVGVRGDGRRRLEELILADDRAVCMAEYFLDAFLERLDEVPAAGERVWLSELGTHCRGAMFLDGAALFTPRLGEAVERVSRSFAGFYFGRYDVRAESAAAFQRGEFKVIELNGLTSEATSIYDPRHSVWFGWRMLCRQWQIAYAIAAENRRRGAPTLTVAETLALVRGAARVA